MIYLVIIDGYTVYVNQKDRNMNAKDVIKNLEVMSQTLEKVANSPQHYNSEYAIYLERMSWEMHKQANEIRELEYMFDLPCFGG